jgi:SAM-dependent methyltransferase
VPAGRPAERQQRLVFGEVAETYDRRRPGYPEGLIDDVLRFSGLDDPSAARQAAVLEVGAGTGKASVLFARRDLALTCVEPSPEMATIASRNLAPYPSAHVVQSSYEDFEAPRHHYALLVAAQSWHWTAAEIRYAKADRLLRPDGGGTIALLWNIIQNRGDEALDRDLNSAYRGLLLSSMWRSDPRQRLAVNDWAIGEMESSGFFGPVTLVRRPWERDYDTAEWLELLSTASDHRMVEETERERLFERIARAVDANGGVVHVEYVSVGYLARTSRRPG